MMRRPAILVLIPAVFLSAWFFTLGRQAQSGQQQLRTQTEEVQRRAFIIRAQLADYDLVKEKYLEWHDTPIESESDYSGYEEIVDFYHQMNQRCNQPRYDLDDITPSLEEVIAFLREWKSVGQNRAIPFNIVIKGRYEDLAALVASIEGDVYFQRLHGLGIAGSPDYYPECRMELAFGARLNQFRGENGHE